MEVEIGSKEDFKEGEGKLIEKEGKQIAVFRKGDKLFAINHVCPHKGGPLAEGMVDEDKVVSCPWHGWQFNIETGISPVNPEAKVETHKIREEDGKVFIWI